MSSSDVFTIDNIDGELCQFENGQNIGKAFELLNPKDYPDEFRALVEDINRRGQNANELYKMSKHREQMFASGFQAGMYIAKFDENEQMTSFEFTDGTRKMLGYDGLEDLPNEFESWVKTLIPEERDTVVKLFWDTVKIHRTLPDISHAEYRMMKKDGSIIWVTGAGEFVRREDGSLEIYMGCYREVTAEHEKEEHLRIIEGVGKVFNFSIYIDAKTEKYRFISSNEYVDQVKKCENAYEFLRANVDTTVDKRDRAELNKWFVGEKVVKALKKNGTISKDFYSDAANAWFKGIFMVSDYDENGEIAHIIYGCQNIDDTKRLELENQKEILDKYKILRSVAEIYNSLHEIDLINNTTVPYSARDKVSSIVNHTNGADKMMEAVMRATVTDEYIEKALEFTDLGTLSGRMKGKKIIQIELVGKDIGWFTASFIAVEQDKNGCATKVIFATRIIDDIKKKEENLVLKSNSDELTRTYNRRAYEEDITELCENGIADDFVYFSIDVNGLKVVNDTIGHNAGDELIIGACDCLKKSIGQFGKVFRTGGDEFVALINANTEQLKNVIEVLDKTVERWHGNLVESLSLSYGYVTRKENKDLSIQEIAILADKRMYEAKSLHYRTQGVDRRGQKDAHIALCSLYTKILKINLTEDSYQIVNMDASEQTLDKGFSEKISVWLKSFGKSGQVHPDDLEEYIKKTESSYLIDYFASGKTSLQIFYRRKIGDEFKQVMMEIIPANDYSKDNQSFFLYVKGIDR